MGVALRSVGVNSDCRGLSGPTGVNVILVGCGCCVVWFKFLVSLIPGTNCPLG